MVKPRIVVVALAACALSACKGSTAPTPSSTTTPPTQPPPTSAPLQSVTISNLPQTMYPPDTAQATSTARYSDNSTQDVTSSATWDSSNTVVATVANGGLVTAKAGGLVDISATFQGMKGTATVTVNLPTLKANAGGPYTAKQGQSVTFSGLQSTSTPNPIAHYSWDCGQSVDPSTYTEHPPSCTQDNPTPTFVYFKCGVPNRPACRQGSTNVRDYTVTLTITDSRGNTNTATTTVTVTNVY